jgi:hypothetical protein
MLDTCLDSLRRSRWPGLAVLVVDNGGDSSDLTGIESNYPEIELIRLPSNAGYAGGCNEGLRRCTSKYVVFLNDDTEVEPGWLGLLVDEAERDRTIGALQPKILSLQAKREGKRLFDYAGAAGGLLDRLGFPFCLGRTFAGTEEDRGQYDAPAELFWASGVALFAPRELLASLGGFDAGFFMHMEEIDLCWRMRLRGYHIRSVPGSVVWHEGGASLRQGSPLKVYYNHRNSLAMLLQNRSAPALSLVVPVRILLELAAFVYYLAGGREGWQRAIQVYRAAADNLRAIGATLLKRREAQGGRRIPERALFRGAPLSVFLLRRATQPSTRDSQ